MSIQICQVHKILIKPKYRMGKGQKNVADYRLSTSNIICFIIGDNKVDNNKRDKDMSMVSLSTVQMLNY